MQLVLSKNRIIAHGDSFLSMGGVVINTETGAKYENATIAECEGGCPSDIDNVGYEYHAGVFVPCAPYGKGNNNGYFMEVCETCATPRSSGIPIKFGLGRENLSIFPLLWENASPGSNFAKQTISLTRTDYVGFIVIATATTRSDLTQTQGTILGGHIGESVEMSYLIDNAEGRRKYRTITIKVGGIEFSEGKTTVSGSSGSNADLVPLKIYGVKL